MFRYAYGLKHLGRFEEASARFSEAADAWGYLNGSFRGSKSAGARANYHRQHGAIAAASGDWETAASSYASALWHSSSTERQWQAKAGHAFAELGLFESACEYYVGM